MALDIANFLENPKKYIMFAEAPVGTGKSLGSLVPSLIDIRTDYTQNKSIIYATSTINLQGQLANEELPTLKKLNMIDKFIVAKGQSHYLCYTNVRSEKTLFTDEQINILNTFYKKSHTGQRSELEDDYSLELDDKLWKKINYNNSPFPCSKCELSRHCSTRRHRSQFKDNHQVVVTNHDQLIVSYQNIHEGKKALLRTDPGIIVIDEAHHFLENFIGRLEHHFSLKQLNNLPRNLRLKDEDTKEWNTILNVIKNWVSEDLSEKDSGRISIPNKVKDSFSNLSKILVGYSLNRKNSYDIDSWQDYFNRINKGFSSGYVSWFDNENKNFALIPTTFKEKFKELIESINLNNKILFMSGTMTVGGDFTTLINQWGLSGEDILTESYKSPFDYNNQSIIYVPKEVSPIEKNYKDKSLPVVQNLLKLTGGSTLMLNTSKDHMQFFYESIKPILKDSNINLFLQGNKGVESLTKLFKEDKTSVLIGSGSFFSGFSVKGTALVSVVLNRLPFPVHNDPVYELMGRGLKTNQFMNQITYPTMVNKLNQATGRLIRDISDFGIITILDERIFTSSDYSEDIQDLLAFQGYNITDRWDDVVTFFKRKLLYGAESNQIKYDRTNLKVHSNLEQAIYFHIPKQFDLSSVIGTHLIEEQKKKVPKKRITRVLTKPQKDFLLDFCDMSGLNTETIKPLIKGETNQAYKEVYKWAKTYWIDTTNLRSNFPYYDVKEQKTLEKFDGGERKIFYPSCDNFKCDGTCTLETRNKIEEYFKKNYNEEISFMNIGSKCLIQPDKKILKYDEFHPGIDKLISASK